MEKPGSILDAHVHLDRILEADPHRVQWFLRNGVGIVSWAFCEGVRNLEDVSAYFQVHAELAHRIKEKGIAAYYVIGIHPRCLPVEEVSAGCLAAFLHDTFSRFLEDPLCLGVGEIGLENGTEREVETLRVHLDTIRPFDKGRVCIHTPRKNKAEMTLRTLEILEEADLDPGRVLVDHLTPDTMQAPFRKGYWLGMTVSSIKCGEEDVREALSRFPDAKKRLLLNTDSNRDLHEDLVRLMKSPSFPEEWKHRLGRENAARFFGIRI